MKSIPMYFYYCGKKQAPKHCASNSQIKTNTKKKRSNESPPPPPYILKNHNEKIKNPFTHSFPHK